MALGFFSPRSIYMRWLRDCLLAVFTLAGLVGTGFAANLTKSDWAAWVQAFGSIAAIGIAIWVPYSQAAKTHREAKDAALIRRVTWRQRLISVTDDVQSYVLLAISSTRSNDTKKTFDYEQVTDLRARLRTLDSDVPDLEAEEVMRQLRICLSQVTNLHRAAAISSNHPDEITQEDFKRITGNVTDLALRARRGITHDLFSAGRASRVADSPL